jgi:NADH:ubiquinone oxidoreductase subunit E
MKPRGENIVTACCGTVCHVKGSQRIITRINNELKLRDGEDTTRDGLFTLEKVNCIGACSIAPVVVINQKVYGMMSPEKMARQLKSCRDQKSE